MNVLVINCGSSSLKFQLINSDTEETAAKGLCERIGIPGSRMVYEAVRKEKQIRETAGKEKTTRETAGKEKQIKETAGKEKLVRETAMENHLQAVRLVLETLIDPAVGVLGSLEEIGAVGHRLVHGGEKFAGSVLITDEVIKATEECSELAPLHNPVNLSGVRACRELMPQTPMVGVFDTAFHQTMPEEAYLYGIPYEYYRQYKIRRYGFHGTSHAYVAGRAAEVLKRDAGELKIIVCHLGNGASITAVKNGESVDTSMGLTPLEGLIMGTRSGDIDPAIVEFLAEKEHKTAAEVLDILNKKSGMVGMQQGGSADFRDILADYNRGRPEAVRTLKAYIYRIAKYIGAYTAAMNGVDAICFTAGIGENSSFVREKVCEYLGYLNIKIDPDANQLRGTDTIISTPDSKVSVMTIPTNEELMIARDTKAVVAANITAAN